jgi:IS4 transposase
MIGEFQPKTTSRSRVVRVFHFALAALLYNVWVILNARVEKHIKVIKLKLSCLWSLPSRLTDLEEKSPYG